MQYNNNYDSEFCGSVPLNFTNHIQSYGVLLVLEKETLEVVQVSRNVEDILGTTPENIIDNTLEGLISETQLSELKKKIHSTNATRLPISLTINTDMGKQEFLTLVHVHEKQILLEMETATTTQDSAFVQVYQDLRHSMAVIDAAKTLEDVWQMAATELKKLSGFDRVLIYQFDEEWNGIVVAEESEDDMDKYLGLRFPASDIPKQARDMYKKNPYRQIPDREYTPVKLYPVLNPITNSFTDLSDCNLRSVAGVHIEYMRNMGIQASMSTRIMKDNKLWGIISCHHRQPKLLNYERCTVFELMSGIISSRLSSLENQIYFDKHSALNELLSQLVEQLYRNTEIADALFNGKVNILSLLQADGAILFIGDDIITTGNVPDKSQLKDLRAWLSMKSPEGIIYSDDFSKQYDEAHQYADVASGLMVIPLRNSRHEFLVCTRQEFIRKVNWGGNPNEAIKFTADKTAYHPRNSFKLWQQTVEKTSLPWRKQEVEIAEKLRHIIIEYAYKQITA